MPYEIKKLTPNLIVSSVEQSLAFYCDVLGFARTGTVPEQSPYVFAMVQSGPVEIFFNAPGPLRRSIRPSPENRLAAR